MLYTEGYESKKNEKFIFNATPYNQDIDIKEIAAIETFVKENGYVPLEMINKLLNYMIYYARVNVCPYPDSPLTSSMYAKCSPTAKIIDELANKMGIKCEEFNIGDVLNRDYGVHQLAIVNIKTRIDGQKVLIKYIMDPTFRQFCIEDENQLSIFDEKTGWSNYMTVPKPGYFFNLTEEGRTFANKLITYGYFVMTPENIKRYFDAFRLYLTPRDEFYYNDLGGTSTTALTSEYYEDRIEKSIKPNKIPARIHVKTPVEIVTEEQRKILNRLKQAIEEFKGNKKRH